MPERSDQVLCPPLRASFCLQVSRRDVTTVSNTACFSLSAEDWDQLGLAIYDVALAFSGTGSPKESD